MSKRALVTGALGFLGSHMVELLVKEGYEVRATDLKPESETDDPKRGRYPSVLKALKVDLIPSDLSRPENLKELTEGVEVAFHVAGLFSYLAPWEALYRVNVEGTQNLIEGLLKNGSLKRLVLWGAGGIYGVPKPEELPIREDSPKRPPNNYLQSKWDQELLAEKYHQTQNLPYTCIRPTGVYGPRAVYGMGKLMMDLAHMKKIRIPKNFNGRAPLVHAVDVCRAALYLSDKEETNGEAYNLADDVTYNNVQMFEFLAELLGKPFKAMPAVPVGLVKGAAIAAATVENFIAKKVLKKTPKLEKDTVFFLGGDFWYTNEKLKKTGFQFTYPDGKEGFRETIPWYREKGLIP